MTNENTPTGDPQPGPRAETQDMAKFFPEATQGAPSPSPAGGQSMETQRQIAWGRYSATLEPGILDPYRQATYRGFVAGWHAIAPGPAGEPIRTYRLRQLVEDLLRKAIGIAEEPSPKWYKNNDEKIAAIKALKDKWDAAADHIRKTTPIPPVQAPAESLPARILLAAHHLILVYDLWGNGADPEGVPPATREAMRGLRDAVMRDGVSIWPAKTVQAPAAGPLDARRILVGEARKHWRAYWSNRKSDSGHPWPLIYKERWKAIMNAISRLKKERNKL